MSPDLEKKLTKKYPRLFQDKNKPDTETMICYGCSCLDGWYQLLDECLFKLDKYPIKLSQVKEKFGELVIYYDFENENEDTEDAKNINIINEISDTIEGYRNKSITICEICGNSGGLTTRGGWFQTLCHSHRKDDYKSYHKEEIENNDRKINLNIIYEDEEY